MGDPSRENVWQMFDEISPTYDRVNRIISLGLDQKWRQKLTRHLPPQKNLKILDIATGTADQALALIQSKASILTLTGIDLSEEMLEIAKKKVPVKMQFLRAGMEEMPFGENSFDVITLSFGIRNAKDPMKALQEIHRVLKPKARALILEFSLPSGFTRTLFLFYLRNIIPYIAGKISKNISAYQYLNQTIEHFPHGDAFCSLLQEAGFQKYEKIPMTFGCVTLYAAYK